MNIHYALPKLFSVFYISYSEHSQMLANNVILQRSDFSDDSTMPALVKIISLGHDLHNMKVLCMSKILVIYISNLID